MLNHLFSLQFCGENCRCSCSFFRFIRQLLAICQECKYFVKPWCCVLFELCHIRLVLLPWLWLIFYKSLQPLHLRCKQFHCHIMFVNLHLGVLVGFLIAVVNSSCSSAAICWMSSWVTFWIFSGSFFCNNAVNSSCNSLIAWLLGVSLGEQFEWQILVVFHCVHNFLYGRCGIVP